MPTITPMLLAMFAGSVVFQVIGITILPITKGLTLPLPTLASGISFMIGIALMGRLIHSGVNLSIVIPLMATLIPLASIAAGVILFGDSASLPKIGMLVVASLLVGGASMV